MKQRIGTVVAFIAHLLIFQSAQAYPDRPVKLVVPSPAGGPPDQIARLLSDKMAAALGQPVIVENRTGGAGGTSARNPSQRQNRMAIRSSWPAQALFSSPL